MSVTVRFIGDEPRDVSILPSGTLRRIEPDGTFEVPDRFAESYACQPAFYDVPGYSAPEPAPTAPADPIDPPADPPADTATTKKKAGN